ncbi:MAG: AAA family ATPase, partial [Lachnospiraceae bacterium]|nr:AAA family ATPase [Lachnospiraceae bacterium]
MKIRRIHIMGFGKLSDYELEFEDGFQVIGAENEFGKSTICLYPHL